MTIWSRALIALGAAWALLACSSYSPQGLLVGDREETVVGLMGKPTDRISLPGGVTRLVYARGPMGRHTYMVDLGPDGGVTQWRQVLGELEFADIVPGMTAEEVLREFGPPAEKRPYRPTRGQIWSYRYQTFECRWFQVTFDPAGRVDAASYGDDPLCDDHGRDRPH
jgi:hypothetical protein